MKQKLESILRVANEIHNYADKFEGIFSEEVREEIMILGDKAVHLTKEVLGLNDDEASLLYDIYYSDYLIDRSIKLDDVLNVFLAEIINDNYDVKFK